MSDTSFIASYEDPNGNDVIGSSTTLEGAQELCQQLERDWADMSGVDTVDLTWTEFVNQDNVVETQYRSQDIGDTVFFVYERPIV